MSTVAEIEAALERLSVQDREQLEAHWLERRFGLGALDDRDRAMLLESIDAAQAEIDSGQAHSAQELREDVRRWAGR